MGQYQPGGRFLVAWYGALSLDLFCSTMSSKLQIKWEYVLNISAISWRWRQVCCIKKKYSKQPLNHLPPKIWFLCHQMSIPPTTPPVCSHVLTLRRSLLLISVILSSNTAVLILYDFFIQIDDPFICLIFQFIDLLSCNDLVFHLISATLHIIA